MPAACGFCTTIGGGVARNSRTGLAFLRAFSLRRLKMSSISPARKGMGEMADKVRGERGKQQSPQRDQRVDADIDASHQ